jgi:hypothetical protein
MKNDKKLFYMQLKKVYTEILEICEKYQNFSHKSGFYDISNMIGVCKNRLLVIEWYDKYGIKINVDSEPYTRDYLLVGKYLSFQHFKNATKCKAEGLGRSISWSDNGKQPKDGWHLVLSFSTGAYIFGEDYKEQKQLFQDFFTELKRYNPDYSDTHNCNLYWKIENAKPIYDKFFTILDKYQKMNDAELKKREAKRLREELRKIEDDL